MSTEDVVTGLFLATFLYNFVHFTKGVVGTDIPDERELYFGN